MVINLFLNENNIFLFIYFGTVRELSYSIILPTKGFYCSFKYLVYNVFQKLFLLR